MTGSGGPTVHPYLEYGGLTSVPGPFRCRDARIVLMPLEADPEALDRLCSTVLSAAAGAPTFERVGRFVLLTFGSMAVRSESPRSSPLFATRYCDMGESPESHVAVWVPVLARGAGGQRGSTDRYAVFIPVMWVDNPVSLVGGREIYGFAKQWGKPMISPDRRRCALDVFGGGFGAGRSSDMHRLVDIVPGGGAHPVAMAAVAVDQARQLARDGLRRLADGEVDLPDGALLHAMASALVDHQFDQVAVRQFRMPAGDGADGCPPELVGITTRFHSVEHEFLGHGFDVTIADVDSHPLHAMFGIRSQTAPFGIEVTADFTLSAR